MTRRLLRFALAFVVGFILLEARALLYIEPAVAAAAPLVETARSLPTLEAPRELSPIWKKGLQQWGPSKT